MEEDCRIINSGVGYMLWVVIVSGCQVAKHVGGSLMEGTYHAYLVQADLWRSPVSEYFEWDTEGRRAIK